MNINTLGSNYNILILLLISFIAITDYNIKNYIIIFILIYFLYINYQLLNKPVDKYNNDIVIKDILINIKKYKKYNRVEYRKGTKLLKQTMFILRHHDKYKHKNYQYDNLKFNISQCLKHYNSILLNIPTSKYIDSVNFNQMKSNYLDFSNLCKQLHDYLYKELYNFGKNSMKNISSNSNYISNDIVESNNFYDSYNIY